jgi:serine/threonine protein kinase/tetratricopeptide (TPR) repeat protein
VRQDVALPSAQAGCNPPLDTGESLLVTANGRTFLRLPSYFRVLQSIALILFYRGVFAMSSGAADLNLLFGIMAVQNDFVSRDALIEAMGAWVLDKSKTLGEILVERGDLSSERHLLLTALVAEHVKAHHDDAQLSLAAVASASSICRQLGAIADSDLQTSLALRFSSVGAESPGPHTTRVESGSPDLELDATGPEYRPGMRYRILRPHAKGGLGEVFVAEDMELHREVALKEIRLVHSHDPVSRNRFLLEAEVTGRLEHPGIVPVYGLGQYADGRPFYAMRFIRGDNLKEAIRCFHEAESPGRDPGERRLALRQLLGRFVDVCNAVAYAHSRGVLHRDLKPGNIMLGKYGETLVVDWGLAKAVGSRQSAEGSEEVTEATLRPSSGSGVGATEIGSAIGTPAYMSPEQAAGQLHKLGPATDIYSLGATLYTLLTGRTPFEGEVDRGRVLQKVQHGTFPAPRKLISDLPRALDAVCLKAMSVKPEDRYPNARALAADIEHWLADEPVSTYPEPLSIRLRRFARKHRTLVTSAAAVLLVATITSTLAVFVIAGLNRRLASANTGLRDSNAMLDASRTLAQENEEKAKTEAATATAVKEFLLKDLLQLASAEKQQDEAASGVKMDPDLKVRDLVLRAAWKIEGNFKDQPLVESEIRSTLGWTLLQIGRSDLAIPQYLRVREIYTAKLGPDHYDTIMSMNNLANSYHAAGRIQEALKLHEKALQLLKAKLGPEHPDTLTSMNNLAASYAAAGRSQDAHKLIEETLRLVRVKLGDDHRLTLTIMYNLAHAYAAAGRSQEALKLREETLRLRKAKLGDDHPQTLSSMDALADSYAAAGRRQEALKLREETLRLRKAKLGDDHPQTLSSMHQLADSYVAAGRSQDALKLREETLQLRKANLGDDHPQTLMSMKALANSYAAAGRNQDALKLGEETLRLLAAKLGPDHPETLTSMNNLASSFAEAGRSQEALKLGEETLRLLKAKLGPDHPSTLMSMNNLANSYLYTREAAKALTLLQETLALREGRREAQPENRLEQSFLAWTHGQIGTAEQARFDYAAAVKAYSLSVELFGKLNQAEALKDPFFRGRFDFYRQQLVWCRKAEQAVKDQGFALQQPAAEVPGLLNMRLQALTARKDQAGVIATAQAYANLAEKDARLVYNAACAWSLAAGITQTRGADAAPLAEEYANKALTFLKKTPTGKEAPFASPAALAAQIKKEEAFAPLRKLDEFKKLLADLEMTPAPSKSAPPADGNSKQKPASENTKDASTPKK